MDDLSEASSTEIYPVYSTDDAILVSLLTSKAFGLGLYWTQWTLLCCDIYYDGRLVIRKCQSSSPIKVLDIKNVEISSISLEQEAVLHISNPLIKREIGLHIKCKKMNGLETYFRCILTESNIEGFLQAIQTLNPDKNLSLHHILSSKPIATQNKVVNLSDTRSSNESVNPKKLYKERIKSRRGAFKWLPARFSNDLIHGSWWFTGGSLVFVISASLTLMNSFDEVIGDDDSILSRYHYRATWVLMIIAGTFFTLGSLAFVRAFHDEPPMKPLFSWYHLQSDELLASWLFLLGSFPAIPFCLIYLSANRDQEIYVFGLIIAGLLVFGCYLFVLASYPSDKEARYRFIHPIARCLCAYCCSGKTLSKYFANDWLAGTWFIYYGTLLACIVSLGLFISGISNNRDLSIFINGTMLLENILFLIGSAYFVAGSFPDETISSESDIDDQGADYILVSEHGSFSRDM